MPVCIGEFISDAMYEGQLRSSHKITIPACWFIDIPGSQEQMHGKSWKVSRLAT